MRKHRKLVVALDGYIVLKIALADLPRLIRQHYYALRHPLHIPQQNRYEYQARRSPRYNVCQRVFAHLRVLAYRYLIQSVGKAHRIKSLALRNILASLRSGNI